MSTVNQRILTTIFNLIAEWERDAVLNCTVIGRKKLFADKDKNPDEPTFVEKQILFYDEKIQEFRATHTDYCEEMNTVAVQYKALEGALDKLAEGMERWKVTTELMIADKWDAFATGRALDSNFLYIENRRMTALIVLYNDVHACATKLKGALNG